MTYHRGLGALVWMMLVVGLAEAAKADDFLLAEGRAWPGRIWISRGGALETYLVRPQSNSDDIVPRVQSLTLLRPGQVAFCSGLDRSIFQTSPIGENRLHHGGYLARQVRTDTDGTLFWSGLETPRDANPLPDGFIYSLSQTTNELRTVLTFSQGDVGRDWWGAFDVRRGQIFVATLAAPSRLYAIRDSIPRLVATLPFTTTAFRLTPDGGLLAANGRGQLFRVANLERPEQVETVLDLQTPFVDFAPLGR